MGASTTELICSAMLAVLDQANAIESAALRALQRGSATIHVNALRMAATQRALIAIGGFSAFEAALQGRKNWRSPFDELPAFLREAGQLELANRFEDYRAAINVLKHGAGRSHDRLLKNKRAAFRVKGNDQPFFEEGDVAEIRQLVSADENFVHGGVDIIRAVSEILRVRQSQPVDEQALGE